MNIRTDNSSVYYSDSNVDTPYQHEETGAGAGDEQESRRSCSSFPFPALSSVQLPFFFSSFSPSSFFSSLFLSLSLFHLFSSSPSFPFVVIPELDLPRAK